MVGVSLKVEGEKGKHATATTTATAMRISLVWGKLGKKSAGARDKTIALDRERNTERGRHRVGPRPANHYRLSAPTSRHIIAEVRGRGRCKQMGRSLLPL